MAPTVSAHQSARMPATKQTEPESKVSLDKKRKYEKSSQKEDFKTNATNQSKKDKSASLDIKEDNKSEQDTGCPELENDKGSIPAAGAEDNSSDVIMSQIKAQDNLDNNEQDEGISSKTDEESSPNNNALNFKQLLDQENSDSKGEADVAQDNCRLSIKNESSAFSLLDVDRIKGEMSGLDYLDPEVCRFADFYFSWCEVEGRRPSSEEGDELLLQVSMLGVPLSELCEVITTHWEGSKGRSTNEWKEIFAQQYSLVHSESVITEFESILQIMLLEVGKTYNPTDKAEEKDLSQMEERNKVAEKNKCEEKGHKVLDGDERKAKENEIANLQEKKRLIEKGLEVLNGQKEKLGILEDREKNELIEGAKKALQVIQEKNEKLKETSSKIDEDAKDCSIMETQVSSAASNESSPSNDHIAKNLDIVGTKCENQEKSDISRAKGTVEDYIPANNVYRVVDEENENKLVFFASPSADILLGKTITYDASQLSFNQDSFLQKKFKNYTYRVTRVYSGFIDDISSEEDLVSSLKDITDPPVEAAMDVETLVKHRVKPVETKPSIKECGHWPSPSFCKYKMCDGSCCDQHEFSEWQHQILLQDIGSYCFRFPKYSCKNPNCPYPHIPWKVLCRAVVDGAEKRRELCSRKGNCAKTRLVSRPNTGCRFLLGAEVTSRGLCRLPTCSTHSCSLTHHPPAHLRLPTHCPAFITDSCSKGAEACTLPHIPYDTINEIFINQKVALEVYCEVCYTEKNHAKKEDTKIEVKFKFSAHDELLGSELENPGGKKVARRSSPEDQGRKSIFSRLGGLSKPSSETRISSEDREIRDEKSRSKFVPDFSTNLKHLEDELCQMLKDIKPVPLGQICVAYNKYYKRQLALSDYGFQRGQLVALVASLNRLEIGAGQLVFIKNPKVEKFSRSTFINNTKKLLQVFGTLSIDKFMARYRREFGSQHQLESYGFHSIEDAVKTLGDLVTVMDMGPKTGTLLRLRTTGRGNHINHFVTAPPRDLSRGRSRSRSVERRRSGERKSQEKSGERHTYEGERRMGREQMGKGENRRRSRERRGEEKQGNSETERDWRGQSSRRESSRSNSSQEGKKSPRKYHDKRRGSVASSNSSYSLGQSLGREGSAKDLFEDVVGEPDEVNNIEQMNQLN